MFKSFILGFLTFLIVDTLWIRLFVKSIYLKHLKSILLLSQGGGLSARIFPAILFYFLFYMTLFYLSVIKSENFKDMIISSLLIGLVSYGTFALTNLAVIKDWNWTLTISDLLWGPVLAAITASVAYYFYPGK